MTDRQECFASEYLLDFNATQAAIRAGYSPRTAYSIGQRLLKNVEIQQAIQAGMTEHNNRLIADRQTRQEFWTSTMLDADTDMKHRLKASELLAKSEGDFIAQVQVQAKLSATSYDLTKLSENELTTLREILLKAGREDITE